MYSTDLRSTSFQSAPWRVRSAAPPPTWNRIQITTHKCWLKRSQISLSRWPDHKKMFAEPPWLLTRMPPQVQRLDWSERLSIKYACHTRGLRWRGCECVYVGVCGNVCARTCVCVVFFPCTCLCARQVANGLLSEAPRCSLKYSHILPVDLCCGHTEIRYGRDSEWRLEFILYIFHANVYVWDKDGNPHL